MKDSTSPDSTQTHIVHTNEEAQIQELRAPFIASSIHHIQTSLEKCERSSMPIGGLYTLLAQLEVFSRLVNHRQSSKEKREMKSIIVEWETIFYSQIEQLDRVIPVILFRELNAAATVVFNRLRRHTKKTT